MESTNPSSPTPPQQPACSEGRVETKQLEQIGSVATSRMPVVQKPTPDAEHTFKLSPGTSLKPLMPWMKIASPDAPLNSRPIAHIGNRKAG